MSEPFNHANDATSGNLTTGLVRERGTLEIFQKASADFFKTGVPYICAILPATAMIYGGSYLALLSALSVADMQNIPLKLLATFIMIAVMAYGFWHFFVYMASLNLTYAEQLSGKLPLKPGQNFKHILAERKNPLFAYLNGFVLVQLVAGIVFSLLVSPLAYFFPPAVPSLLAQILIFLAYTWFSMGFQLVAMGPETSQALQKGTIGLLKQSKAIVSENYGRCFTLLLISYLLTYYLIPGVFVSLAELTGAIPWFNQFHQGLIESYRLQLSPVLLSLLELPDSNDISHQVSQFLLTGIVNSLLLPWGTFVYALAYGSLLSKRGSNQAGTV